VLVAVQRITQLRRKIDHYEFFLTSTTASRIRDSFKLLHG
jgi:hypothetical protein